MSVVFDEDLVSPMEQAPRAQMELERVSHQLDLMQQTTSTIETSSFFDTAAQMLATTPTEIKSIISILAFCFWPVLFYAITKTKVWIKLCGNIDDFNSRVKRFVNWVGRLLDILIYLLIFAVAFITFISLILIINNKAAHIVGIL